MKKLTLLSGLALLSGSLTFLTPASGQITIDQSDLPSAGLKVVTDSDGTSKPSPGTASALSQNWDFSTLKKQKAHTVEFMFPGNTPWASDFPTANLADSTVGKDGYNFFLSNSTQFSAVGSEDTVYADGTLLQILMNLNPVFEQSNLSATYNDKIKGVARGEQVINKSVSIFSKIMITVTITYSDTIDAWGNLKMPNGKTYPVLRQKHQEVEIDSAFGYFLGWNSVDEVVTNKSEYNWYAKGVGYILAEMDMNPTFSTINDIIWDTTAPAPVSTGLNEISGLGGKTNAYPNPCSSEINIVSSVQSEQYLTIYDITGRQLYRDMMKNGLTTLNTSTYSNGIYLYVLTDNSGKLVDRGRFAVQK